MVASSLNQPQQIYVDESINAAFVVEGAPSAGRLLRISLATGSTTVRTLNLDLKLSIMDT